MEKKNVVGKVAETLKQNNTTIMFVGGAITLLTGVGLAIRATLKAHDVLTSNYVRTEVDEDGNETTVERTLVDTLKLIGKIYAVPGVCVVAGMSLMTASHVMSVGKSASAMVMAGMVAGNANEWKDKAKEILGEKNVQKVTDAIAQEKAENLTDEDLTPPWDASDVNYDVVEGTKRVMTDIVPYDDNDTLVEDGLTGQKIWTNREKLNETMLKLGEWVNSGEDVTLNDYLDEIGGKRVSSDWGSGMGWKAYENRPHFRLSKAVAIGGKQYVVIEHDVAPIPLYER